MPLNLTKREAQRLGIVPQDDGTPTKKAREWGSGPVGAEVAGWSLTKTVVEGLAYPGGTFVHRWQARDAQRWLARCGRERCRDGWLPVQGKGERCERCYQEKEKDNDAG